MFFTQQTSRKEYERIRRIARFWRVYDASHYFIGMNRQPRAEVREFWQLFSPAPSWPETPIAVRLSAYTGRDIDADQILDWWFS